MKLTLIRKDGKKIEIENRFLNELFIDDCVEFYIKKHKLSSNFQCNSYFTSKAVQEFIIDNNEYPVYEDEQYKSYVQTHMEKLFA